MGSLNGLLAVNKPSGMSSKDASRRLVRRFGKLKFGHVGTLDPSAEGVLPILVGRATRLQDYLLELPKVYRFTFKMGFETNTLDMDGTVVRESPFEHVTQEMIEKLIPDFVGEIIQVPPMYSAVKFNGKPLYKYARAGRDDAVPIDDLRRTVSIHNLKLCAFKGDRVTLDVRCSRGTYVRVLIKDLAAKLGTCATLQHLCRTEAANLTLSETHRLADLESGESLADYLVPMEAIKVGFPIWQSSDSRLTSLLRRGQKLTIESQAFDRGIQSSLRPSRGNFSKPLMLVDHLGSAIGLGAVCQQNSGRVAISLKRGL